MKNGKTCLKRMKMDNSTNFNIWKYKEDIYNFILGYVAFNKDVAENIVQQTFEKALKNKHNYKESGSMRAWLTRIAKNVFIDMKREDKLNLVYSDKIDALENIVFDVRTHHVEEEDDDSDDLDSRILNKMVLKLPKKQQEIIKLYYFENLSFVEIANYTGDKLNTLLGRMYYAKKNLKNLIMIYKKI